MPIQKKELKEEGAIPQACQLRQVKYLNNIVEQDHHFIKRRVKPGLGFFSAETAWNAVQEYEVMHLIRKRQIRDVEQGEVMEHVTFISGLFGVAA